MAFRQTLVLAIEDAYLMLIVSDVRIRIWQNLSAALNKSSLFKLEPEPRKSVGYKLPAALAFVFALLGIV